MDLKQRKELERIGEIVGEPAEEGGLAGGFYFYKVICRMQNQKCIYG